MKNIFAIRLRELRGDYSQNEFCGIIGVPQTSYSGWEKGGKSPSANVIIQISNAIGVSTDYLLGLSDDRRGVVVYEPSPEMIAKMAAQEKEIERLNAELTRVNGENTGFRYALESFAKKN